MDPTHVAILLFVFCGLVLVGVPIAFALGLSASAVLLVALEPAAAVTTVAQRMATGLDSFALLAIPLFILSGELMNRGGAARRLVDLGRVLVSRLPSGLLFVNVLACMLFGAISGSAVAAAAAIGGFMVPVLEDDGFDRGDAAALNVAAATTGLLIPPSNILIVYALASGGVSIAALFVAGYLPGILVGILVAIAAALNARRRRQTPRRDPALAGASHGDSFLRVLVRALPSLLLIVVVMGGIVAGVFTATEAAGVAVLYALALALVVHREIEVSDLRTILLDASATTGVVMLLIASSMALSWVMAWERIPQTLTSALLEHAGGGLGLLLLVNVILLVVGTFMDITPAVLIFTPIFLPVARDLGLDPIHFGIVIVLNLCIGLCTPPVGTVLFVGAGVARVPLGRLLPGLVPLWLAMIVGLAITAAVPALSLWLPGVLGLL